MFGGSSSDPTGSKSSASADPSASATGSTPPSVPPEVEELIRVREEQHLHFTTDPRMAEIIHNFLPPRWLDRTAPVHMQTAYDPEGKRKYYFGEGSKTPDTVRAARFVMAREQGLAVMDPATQKYFLICPADHEFHSIQSFESDHAQRIAEIQRRQEALLKRMNDEPGFADSVMKHPSMADFFHQVDGRYYGTLFFYDSYYNDIDNLWLICSSCNLHKSEQDPFVWFKDNPIFGQEFITSCEQERLARRDGILEKTPGRRKGLAELAIDWYLTRHAVYVRQKREFQERVVHPVDAQMRHADASRLSPDAAAADNSIAFASMGVEIARQLNASDPKLV